MKKLHRFAVIALVGILLTISLNVPAMAQETDRYVPASGEVVTLPSANTSVIEVSSLVLGEQFDRYVPPTGEVVFTLPIVQGNIQLVSHEIERYVPPTGEVVVLHTIIVQDTVDISNQ